MYFTHISVPTTYTPEERTQAAMGHLFSRSAYMRRSANISILCFNKHRRSCYSCIYFCFNGVAIWIINAHVDCAVLTGTRGPVHMRGLLTNVLKQPVCLPSACKCAIVTAQPQNSWKTSLPAWCWGIWCFPQGIEQYATHWRQGGKKKKKAGIFHTEQYSNTFMNGLRKHHKKASVL